MDHGLTGLTGLNGPVAQERRKKDVFFRRRRGDGWAIRGPSRDARFLGLLLFWLCLAKANVAASLDREESTLTMNTRRLGFFLFCGRWKDLSCTLLLRGGW